MFPSNPSLRTWYLGTIVHFLIILISLLAVLSVRNKMKIKGHVSQCVHVPV